MFLGFLLSVGLSDRLLVCLSVSRSLCLFANIYNHEFCNGWYVQLCGCSCVCVNLFNGCRLVNCRAILARKVTLDYPGKTVLRYHLFSVFAMNND